MELHYNESPAASWLKQSPAASWVMQKLGGPINVTPNERLISTVAGGVLLLNALVRPGIASLFGGLVGGALLSRGTTGHCPIYSALGKSTLATTTGADGAPSQFAQQQADSTMQAHISAPRDTASTPNKIGSKVGFGSTTSVAKTNVTSAGPSPLSLGAKMPDPTHVKN